ncbi:hypothetical protein C8Q77DRAFT_1065756 [Trametes polyzona]|nr:hypothetical protein C8Q77DRAFT_1065756 [Trametes polyzona]
MSQVLSEACQFIPTEWIGCGKVYPSADTPEFIEAARREVLTIPSWYTTLLPDSKLSVLEFLALPLPTQPSVLVNYDAQRVFSFDSPTDSLTMLVNRPIPSPEFIQDMHKAFGQAWFSGAQSIIDPRYKQSRVPFYALTYWKEMSFALAKRAAWKLAEGWLARWERLPGFLEEADHARVLLGALPWSSRVEALGSDTGAENLALLLSDQWLDDELINMLLQELYGRARLDPKLSRYVVVLPLALQQVVHNAAAKKDYTHALLQRCKRYVDTGRRHLYFPVNIGNAHWVPCMIDFEDEAIRYGDSLASTSESRSMRSIVNDLQAWLLHSFGVRFASAGNSLAHGLQGDGHSCGICTVNTVEHAIFGVKLFTHSDRYILRVRYFNRLMMAHNDHVRRVLLDLALPTSPPTDLVLPTSRPTDLVPPSSLTPLSSLAPSTSPLSSLAPPTDLALPTSPRSSLAPPTSLLTDFVPPTSLAPRSSLAPSTDLALPTSPPSSLAPLTSLLTDLALPTSPPTDLSDCSSDSDLSDQVVKKRRTMEGYVGASASAVASQRLKNSMRDGSFKPNPARLRRFKTTCQEYDALAEFSLEDKWKVYHSECGRWYTMKEAYHTQRFRAHVATCSKRLEHLAAGHCLKGKAAGPTVHHGSPVPHRTSTLDSWAKSLGWTKKKPTLSSTPLAKRKRPGAGTDEASRGAGRGRKLETVPCAGLTASSEPRVLTYLRRTGAQGGGAPSVTSLARSLFKNESIIFAELSREDKETVLTEQKHRWAWHNDHTRLAVYSTACNKTVKLGSVCPPCEQVLYTKAFRNAMNVPMPDKENCRFINNQYRNAVLGKLFARVYGLDELLEDKTSPDSIFTRFSIMARQGRFDGEARAVFLELIKAMVTAEERSERGVGNQKFNYGPALLEFSHTCAIMSPELYRGMKKHLQLPEIRTLGRQRAKLPPFPIDICARNFENAKTYLNEIGCSDSPVALSCDDTKLHPAWRTYYDPGQKQHFLVGGTGPPRAIANIDELRTILKEAQEKDKATKLRLWCLQPTLPKIPPLIVAAKAIPNSVSAEELYTMLLTVLHGIIDAGIQVVSYSSDGTESERSIQKMLIDRADMVHTYTIPHPLAHADIPIRIAVIHGQSIVIVQDSKHGAKTFRNNICSGARAVTLGNHPVFFSMLHDLAFSVNSPLYHRDVVKLDRQDDNAATRLYASATLRHIIKTFPGYIGLIVYLFVFGELIDAYQNRSISHRERIKMVLRAKYFLQLWQTFLDKGKYPASRYCISREALDIARILIDGLIALCRKLIKDFTHLDFLYMVPRLSILVRAACRFATTSDPRARAGGYAHTYFDSGNADLALLAVFPSDSAIAVASQEAWDEASNLWDLLGVSPPDIFPQAAPASQPTSTVLPSVSSWFPHGEDPVYDCDPDAPSEDEFQESDSEDELCESALLQKFIDAEEGAPMRTALTEERMTSLTCAAVALTLNDLSKVQAFEEPDAYTKATQLREDAAVVADTFAAVALPALSSLPADPVRPFDRAVDAGLTDLDLSTLVSVREGHETERARKGVRTRTDLQTLSPREPLNAAIEPLDGAHVGSIPQQESARQALIREMQQALREEQDRGAGTGLERDARWRAHVVTTTAGTQTRNSANAALAAGARAAAVIRRRLKYFQEQKVPMHQDLADALVGSSAASARHATLRIGSYVVVVHKGRLFVGRVLAMYTRGGGKAGFHSSQEEVKSIGLISYLVVQLYEHAFNRRFRAIHQELSTLQIYKFLHIPSDDVLLRLPAECTLSQDQRTLDVDACAHDIFSRLASATVLPGIREATKLLAITRRRGRQTEGEDDEGRAH